MPDFLTANNDSIAGIANYYDTNHIVNQITYWCALIPDQGRVELTFTESGTCILGGHLGLRFYPYYLFITIAER